VGEHEEERDGGEADESGGAPVSFYVPPDQEAGVYANTVAVWHTAYDFTIDFAATQLPQQTDRGNPESSWVVPARVVARIRIPPTLVFDVIQTINARMEVYEAEWGEIARPEREQGDEHE
jgi:Protein of unknown function (DUF3467)